MARYRSHSEAPEKLTSCVSGACIAQVTLGQQHILVVVVLVFRAADRAPTTRDDLDVLYLVPHLVIKDRKAHVHESIRAGVQVMVLLLIAVYPRCVHKLLLMGRAPGCYQHRRG